MKIKITQAGSEAFNGWIGDVEFVNGVSVEDQPEQAIAHVSAIYSVELVEDKLAKEVAAPEVVKTSEVVAATSVVETAEVAETPDAAEEQAETASTDAPAGE